MYTNHQTFGTGYNGSNNGSCNRNPNCTGDSRTNDSTGDNLSFRNDHSGNYRDYDNGYTNTVYDSLNKDYHDPYPQ